MSGWDDDDWTGTPPEGSHSRDRADPGFWARQHPIMPAAVGLFVVLAILALAVLL